MRRFATSWNLLCTIVLCGGLVARVQAGDVGHPVSPRDPLLDASSVWILAAGAGVVALTHDQSFFRNPGRVASTVEQLQLDRARRGGGGAGESDDLGVRIGRARGDRWDVPSPSPGG